MSGLQLSKQDSIRLILVSMLVSTIAAYFRLFQLDFTGYWIDEMSSIHFASHPFFGALFWDNSPPLYHLLLKIWIALFGNSESATRSLSGLISLATTFVWMREGLKRNGIAGMLACGLVHAVMSLSILHAREVRMYALYELASTIFLVQVVSIIEGKSVRPLHLVLSIFFLALTHFLSVIPLGLGLGAIGWRNRRTIGKRALIGIGVIVILATLVAWFFIQWGPLSWQKLKFNAEPGSRWPTALIPLTFGSWIGLFAFLGLVSLQVRKKNIIAIASSIAIFISLAVATIAALVSNRAVFQPRYFIHLAPLIMLIIVSLPLNFSRKDTRSLALWVVVAILSASFITKSFTVMALENPPWRRAAEIIYGTPNPVVYTSRPLSLRTPYFDDLGLQVQPVSLLDSGMAKFVADARSGHTVWIIENYWGITYYRKQLEAYVNDNGCNLRPTVLRNNALDSINLIQVVCP